MSAISVGRSMAIPALFLLGAFGFVLTLHTQDFSASAQTNSQTTTKLAFKESGQNPEETTQSSAQQERRLVLTNEPFTPSDTSFTDLSWPELRSLSQEELLNYMLDYRYNHLFETDYMAREYELFRYILEFEPFAALDYMVAIGHDASSEFFYNFLYSDFVVNNGKGPEVVDYINRFGPQVNLMNLIVFANLAGNISEHVRQEILTEYVLGNADYHAIIKAAQWMEDLTADQRMTAFLNTTPEFVDDPYDLIKSIVAMNDPASYEHLKRYLIEHPDKFRLYSLVRTLTDLPLDNLVTTQMQGFLSLTFDDQIQSALMALDFGNIAALKFLCERAQQPIILRHPINVEYNVLKAVSTPGYIEKNLSWIEKNLSSLSFNPFTKKFEYY